MSEGKREKSNSNDWKTKNFENFRIILLFDVSFTKLYSCLRTLSEVEVKLWHSRKRNWRNAQPARSAIIFPEFVRTWDVPWIAIRTSLMSEEVQTRQISLPAEEHATSADKSCRIILYYAKLIACHTRRFNFLPHIWGKLKEKISKRENSSTVSKKHACLVFRIIDFESFSLCI